MVNFSGLSATYPGFQAQEDQTAKTQANQTAARDAAIKLLGQRVAGAALAGVPAGPQPPAPGQPSVPSAPAPPPGAPPAGPIGGGQTPPGPSVPPPTPPAAMPPPAPPQAALGATGAPTGKMNIQQATARILQATPGVAQHPEILLAALNHMKAAGVLDPDAENTVDAIGKQHTMNRVAAAKGHLQAVQAAAPSPFVTGAPPVTPTPSRPAVTPPAPAVATPPTVSAPPVALLKPNTITTFQNGQKWTLGPDGQPKQVS